MRKLKGLWSPLLSGVLLMAILVGVASARPTARPLEQAWRVLTVPHGNCIPNDEAHNIEYHMAHLENDGGAAAIFLCSVNFPAAGEQAVGAVNVKRLTMYAYDNTGGEYADVVLKKTYPPTGGHAQMGMASTLGNLPDDPRAVVDTTIEYNPVYRTQGPYLWLLIVGTSIKVYGFFIHYTW